MTTMQLALNTWGDVERYLETSKLIVIPIGSTEQHGPNGALGTDFICAEEIARRVGERTNTLVAPTIPVGMALHHMAFPGTISLQPATMMALLRDWVSSLYTHGFRDFVFINGHGGNSATAESAFSAMREEMADARLVWMSWFMGRSVLACARELFGDREGGHATPSEISVTMAAYPEEIHVVDGPFDVGRRRGMGIPGSKQFREIYPDGRMGSDPSLARPEHGHRLIAEAVNWIGERVERMRQER